MLNLPKILEGIEGYTVHQTTQPRNTFNFVRPNFIDTFTLYCHPTSCSEVSLWVVDSKVADKDEFVENLKKLRAGNITRITFKRVNQNKEPPMKNWKLLTVMESVYGAGMGSVECYELLL